ncbi:MAG: stage II sporulation protein P [Clostridia bacterium]|nr:stage II sporulation protein P [Clostridia bacterium]
MKNTVSFFNAVLDKGKEVKEKFFGILKRGTGLTFGASIFIVLGITLLRTPKMFNGLFAFATNVREKNKANIDITALLKAYPVLNVDNYIVAKAEVEQVVEKEKKPKKDVIQSPDTSLFDASVVDVNTDNVVLKETEMIKKSTKTYTRIDLDGVTILDYSSKKIDYEELMNMKVELKKAEDKILMYSTHTSESYTNSDLYKFKYSSTFRSKDAKYNMLSVMHILNETLKEKGITTVMDKTSHDYTSYNSAYKNSMNTLNKNLKEHSHFGLVIDVHRDASSDLTFGPKLKINGKDTAKLMIVIGVGYQSLENKYWKENLAVALKIAKVGEAMYPGLFRHILVRDSRYNQHIEDGSILIEVGATGNTLEEAYYGVRCLGNIIGKIYE